MTRRDFLLLVSTLGPGLYLWFARPSLMASLLMAYVVVAMLTLTVAAVLRALGVRTSGAKRTPR